MSYLKAYEQGFDVRKSGGNQSANPHDKNSEAWDGWNDGWLDCEFENKTGMKIFVG